MSKIFDGEATHDVKKLTIVHYPDPRLRGKCRKVSEFDDGVAALGRKMLELMRASKGVGLAAPQVGVLLRMFVMNATDDPKNDLVVINPTIKDKQDAAEAVEGCLSLPGIDVNVRRAAKCCVSAQNVKGETFEIHAEALTARICQHETDHLNGVLIIDRMTPADKIATRKTLAALEAAYHKKKKPAVKPSAVSL